MWVHRASWPHFARSGLHARICEALGRTGQRQLAGNRLGGSGVVVVVCLPEPAGVLVALRVLPAKRVPAWHGYAQEIRWTGWTPFGQMAVS